jgi:protein SCO1/2
MEDIQRLVADAPDVQLLSLSVDPRTDTPSVLRAFAENYHADPRQWWFLTGDKAELYRLIETSFLPKSTDLQDIIPGGFAGTDRIMLVDRQGKVRACFNGLRPRVAAAVLSEINHLRKSSGRQ